MTFVIDASAVVALLSEDRDGHLVAQHLAADDEIPWTVPLMDAEVGQALRGMVRRGDISAKRAGSALDRLRTMPLRRTGMVSLLRPSWKLRDNLTFYDSLYVSLAHKLDAPLLTLDQRLAAAPKLPVRVMLP